MRKSGFTNLTSFADTSVLYDAQDGKDVLDKMKKMKRERKAAKGAAKKGGKERVQFLVPVNNQCNSHAEPCYSAQAKMKQTNEIQKTPTFVTLTPTTKFRA